ncbi:MAG TPA: type II secretion system minor pseudopilin GspK [Xanthomonadaceae bacterium]|nr:type II secretion system minor pseudopilin GspK [Xanthomonadaceae bacterium]
MTGVGRHARGAALMLVLWLIALLTALVGAFALSARIESMQGQVLARGLIAAQAARAGQEYSITRLNDPDPTRQWRPDGRPYRWTYAGAEVEVRIVDELGKVDLNAADAPLLTALFRAVGIEPDVATGLASAILDWRDPDILTQPQGGAEDPDYAAAGRAYGAKDGPFDTVAEVEQVLGMTPPLYVLAATHLTVYSGQAQPQADFASGPVLTALGQDGTAIVAARERQGGPLPGEAGSGFVGAGSGTYSIDSRARLADGRAAALRTVLRVGGNGLPGSVYTPLRWEEGTSTR